MQTEEANDSSHAYTRFFSITHSTIGPRRKALDPMAERLLNFLAVVWASQVEITVLEVLATAPSLSRSLAHHRLKRLRYAGFIQRVLNEKDNRVKWVRPTPMCLDHFARMAQCVLTACSRGGSQRERGDPARGSATCQVMLGHSWPITSVNP